MFIIDTLCKRVILQSNYILSIADLKKMITLKQLLFMDYKPTSNFYLIWKIWVFVGNLNDFLCKIAPPPPLCGPH